MRLTPPLMLKKYISAFLLSSELNKFMIEIRIHSSVCFPPVLQGSGHPGGPGGFRGVEWLWQMSHHPGSLHDSARVPRLEESQTAAVETSRQCSAHQVEFTNPKTNKFTLEPASRISNGRLAATSLYPALMILQDTFDITGIFTVLCKNWFCKLIFLEYIYTAISHHGNNYSSSGP